MNDLVPAMRGRPGSQAIHVRYEAAGLVLYELPVPVMADAVIVEVLLRLPAAARQKADYVLRIPGSEPIIAEQLRKDERDPSRYRIIFRVPTPQFSTRAELLWRNRLLSETSIPIANTDEFLKSLSVTNPTVTVQLAEQCVTARTFVATQCQALTTAIVLKSPTALIPLTQLGLRVVFRSERTAWEQVVPVSLTSSQLTAKEVLLTASPAKFPRKSGTYSATWYAGNRELAVLKMQSVTGSAFVQSLRLSDTRFLLTEKSGAVRVVRHAPPSPSSGTRIGPCFVVCSNQPGMAGWITLQVVSQPAGESPTEFEQRLLITDGPTMFTPGMLPIESVQGLNGFELRYKNLSLGMMSIHPVPIATFNSEGGFKPPPEFAWTPIAEDELSERLAKLMKDDPK